MSTATQTPTRSGVPTDQAPDYAEQRLAFKIHAMVAAVSMVLIFIVNLYTNAVAGITGEIWAWWSVWVLVGWGSALMIHGLLVMLVRPAASA